MLRKILLTALFVNLACVVACGSDDAAQKKDEPATAEKAEEPAKEEPAAEPEADLSAFDSAGVLQEATSKGGKAGMSISNVTGAFADCGLKDGDVIVAINGAAVEAGRAGATQLKKACVAGEAVTVERDGAEVPAK